MSLAKKHIIMMILQWQIELLTSSCMTSKSKFGFKRSFAKAYPLKSKTVSIELLRVSKIYLFTIKLC